MFVITSYKRFDGETEEELILRICENKEQIGSWEDVAAVINKLTGNDFGESTYRKKYQSFKKMLEANQSKFVDSSEQLEEIRLAQRELERSKIQFRDERNAWQKQNFIDARAEQKLDKLEEELRSLGKINFEKHNKTHVSSDNDILLILSDLHIGQTFETFFGKEKVQYLNFNTTYYELFPHDINSYTDYDGHMNGDSARNYSEILAYFLKK